MINNSQHKDTLLSMMHHVLDHDEYVIKEVRR